MIKLKDILNESNGKASIQDVYDWLYNGMMKKQLGSMENQKKVKKELKTLRDAMDLVWKYERLVDGGHKPNEYFK